MADRRSRGVARQSGQQQSPLVAAAMVRVKAAWDDPVVRRRVLQQAQVAGEWARQYQSQRSHSSRGPGVVDRVGESVGARFGSKRLEARVDRLRGALASLERSSPELAGAVGPLRQEIDDIATHIPVAEALSGRPKRRVLSSLDDRLDQLEASLADAILPEPPM